MIGINISNNTSAKKDDIKADTSRELILQNDLENDNDYIGGTIFVNPLFTKENDISESISNKFDNLKHEFNNEINSNPENKFGNLSFYKKDNICSNILKELDLKIDLANKNIPL